MDLWIWLFILVVTVLIEAASMNLLSIWFAVGALVSFIAALLDLNFGIQISVFLFVSFILLVVTRPIASKYFQTKIVRTNLDRVVGKVAIVTEPITQYQRGACKVDGKEWSAVVIKDESLVVGDKVKVLAIEGVKLIVEHME